MTNTIKLIEEILETGDFELVSYGLAPNPDGFCYEFIGEVYREAETELRLNELLYGLTNEETRILKKRYL